MRPLLALFIVAFSVLPTAHSKDEKPKDNCNNFNGVVISALIDVSEPLNAPQRLAYNKLIDKIVNDTPGNSRFDLYKIATKTTGIEPPIFSRCKPWPKSELLKGEKFWEKRIDRDFNAPLKYELQKLGHETNLAQFSPVLESLYSMSIRSFVADKSGRPLRGKVIIISDFLQHSPNLSVYTPHPSYSAWRSSADGRSWLRKFPDVEMDAIVIPRSGKSTLPLSARDFFFDYFQDNFSKHRWRDISAALGD